MKKIISLLLVVFLCFSVFSISAFAEAEKANSSGQKRVKAKKLLLKQFHQKAAF